MTVELASKSRKTFVIFDTPNLTSPYRIVNSAVPQTTPFGVFESDMKLDVELPKYTGYLKEGSAKVTFDLSSDFSQRVSDGRPHPKVAVTIFELEKGWIPGSYDNQLTTLRYLYEGEISSSKRNPNKKEGLVQVEVLGLKSELNYALGLQSNEDCPQTLGDPHTCGANTEPYIEMATISNINGLVITAPGISQPWANIWNRGYVSKDGLNIRIRYRDGESDLFHLAQIPPSDWLNSSVSFNPGCDKTRSNCSLWQNVNRYNGLGIGTPNRHPVFENGS